MKAPMKMRVRCTAKHKHRYSHRAKPSYSVKIAGDEEKRYAFEAVEVWVTKRQYRRFEVGRTYTLAFKRIPKPSDEGGE